VAFKASYLRGDTRDILRGYKQEQAASKTVDAIDKRDSIDPNTKLFQATIGLDNFCNAIESAYTSWAKSRHYPYDKSVPPGVPPDVFVEADKSLPKMPGYFRHPTAYS